MAQRKPLRQGDVLLIPVEAEPEFDQRSSWGQPTTDTPPDRKRENGVVLAFGEVTGHAHVLQTDSPLIVGRVWTGRIWEAIEYLDLLKPATLVHEEHAALEVPEGKWRVIHQREYAGPQRTWSNVRD